MRVGPGNRKSPGKYIYPFLECDEHAGPQRSYGVCVHVLKDGMSVIKQIQPADDENMGMILCEPCTNAGAGIRLEDFRAICEGCCKKLKFVPS